MKEHPSSLWLYQTKVPLLKRWLSLGQTAGSCSIRSAVPSQSVPGEPAVITSSNQQSHHRPQQRSTLSLSLSLLLETYECGAVGEALSGFEGCITVEWCHFLNLNCSTSSTVYTNYNTLTTCNSLLKHSHSLCWYVVKVPTFIPAKF